MRKSLVPKAEAKKEGSANNESDETQDHPFQREASTEYSKFCRSSRYTNLEALRVILLQKNWLNKTCIGSQEVQQLWQTEADFQRKKTITRI